MAAAAARPLQRSHRHPQSPLPRFLAPKHHSGFPSCGLQGPEEAWTCLLVILLILDLASSFQGRPLLRVFLICTELRAVISDTPLCSVLLMYLKSGPYPWSPPCPGREKAAASAPEGVLPMPLLLPSSVLWNSLECQMAMPVCILLVRPSTHLQPASQPANIY